MIFAPSWTDSVDDAWAVALREASGGIDDPEAALAALVMQCPPLSETPVSVLGVCGPGGVGKDTVIAALAGTIPLAPLVFDTTRTPRAGEAEGVAYYFVRPSRFMRRTWGSAYAFRRRIAGRGAYGLRKRIARSALQARALIVAKEAPTGLAAIFEWIRREAPQRGCALVYLLPPWPIERNLQARLAGRGEARTADARHEAEARRQIDEFRDFVSLIRIGFAGRIVINTKPDVVVSHILTDFALSKGNIVKA